MQILEVRRAQPYYPLKQVAEMTGRTVRTVQRKIAGIQREIERGRYSPYALAGNLVNYYVYLDYIKYEKRLEDKNMRKTVPEFDPEEIMRISGFGQRLIDIKD
ncbi:MAG: hypothetical protein ACI4F9_07715 [Lachnospiraceae bacterium]